MIWGGGKYLGSGENILDFGFKVDKLIFFCLKSRYCSFIRPLILDDS